MKRYRIILCMLTALALAVVCLPAAAAAAPETALDADTRRGDVTVQPDDPLRVASAENPASAAHAAGTPVVATGTPQPSWALLNLVFAILCVGVAIALSLGLVGAGGSRLRGVIRTLTLLPAVCSAGLFLLTQDLSRGMCLTDRWTAVMLAAALLQGVLLIILAAHRPVSSGGED